MKRVYLSTLFLLALVCSFTLDASPAYSDSHHHRHRRHHKHHSKKSKVNLNVGTTTVATTTYVAPAPVVTTTYVTPAPVVTYSTPTYYYAQPSYAVEYCQPTVVQYYQPTVVTPVVTPAPTYYRTTPFSNFNLGFSFRL